jgi:cold shock protein
VPWLPIRATLLSSAGLLEHFGAEAEQLATGRVLQFDQERGYGFIAADDGGEDIFLHASAFDGDSYELAAGMRMEFKIMAGDRGRKAFGARVIPDEPDPGNDPATSPRPVPPAPSPSPVPVPRPVPVPPLTQPLSAPVPPQAHEENVPDDESMCDVLSPTEFGQELTELLLNNAPTLTGQQILDVRQGVMECVRKHGWVDP